MPPQATFQSVILTLQQFWADHGCLIAQPYYSQVGAGTMNPATFLRVLGPEPWRVAYVEPSIRPDDGRYGENPNRLQQFYQYQVILKPDPGDPQELYLRSLQAIGVDPARHDLRFVEDKWESPALGAWGLGWEVWLDGQEITQFTYFQQAGGQTLDPVSVEITYGLERILIGLLALDHFEKIPWNGDRSYGEILRRAEQEHTRYYLDHADVERTRAAYDLSEAEAAASIENGLVLPAYDHLLKCSHAFNILDARGGVGVAERAVLFGRMRDLARQVAEAYLEQRRELGFPWKQPSPGPAPPPADATPPPGEAEHFVFEIGTEELPTADVTAALAALPDLAADLLAKARLPHGAVRAVGTPRRLILEVEALAPAQADLTEWVKGPPEARAFDADGAPTRAAQGWATKLGLDPEPSALRALVRDIEGGRYLAAEVIRHGQPASAVLADQVLPALIAALPFEHTMRWIGSGDGDAAEEALRRTAFARPIRWLLALHGDHVVPLAHAGLLAGRTTRGLRFAEPASFEIARAADLGRALAESGLVVDPADRRGAIRQQGEALAAGIGGEMDPDPALLEEVAHLVEAPYVVLGSFEASFLDLPEEVLTAVMKKHQRYFPVRNADGGLLPAFLAVGNGTTVSPETVRQGNEHVLRARFADAAFFLAKDRSRPLEGFRPLLERLTFHAGLGSMLGRTERIEKLAGWLATDLNLEASEGRALARAATLCKADLATSMLAEMTSLQGVLGRIYARESGEPEAVAQAIEEHYRPRHGGDALPASRVGAVLGLADRLDSLCGLFATGAQPSGTRDPLGLRRAAIGLVQILVGHSIRTDLRRWLAAAADGLPIEASQESVHACLEFIVARAEVLLLAEGRRHDVVAAALAARGHDPAGAWLAAAGLETVVAETDWTPTLQAYARCARIVRGQRPDGAIDPDRFASPAEHALLRAVDDLDRPLESVERLAAALKRLVPPITDFFDDVLVMDEDPAQRANRLALVGRVVELADGIADLSKLEGF